MYTLKDKNMRIVLKRDHVTVTAEALVNNQNLAHLILNDLVYNQRYGHNLQWNGDKPPRKLIPPNQDIEIEVNVKKKSESEPIASTLTEAPIGGEPLSKKEKRPTLIFSDLREPKETQKRVGSQKRK